MAEAIEAVGAEAFADRPVGQLSGGEQQRLRVAQALVGAPDVLLCDEPLLSLDLAHQPFVDRVLYLVDGRFRIGPPDDVMTSGTLTELYRTPIDVVRVRGQIHVVGAQSGLCEDQPHHHLDDEH